MMDTPNGIGNVRAADISDEMQVAYLDYAMSVIVSRALPDVRDGLKPVHRRILYAMYHDLGLLHSRPHKKSARIVGEVLGKYHPHGDTAVYDAMVRMAQEFSLRYPLIDGQGNFGSVDGDNAAAMRYTEARLGEISNLMLDDLDKETVDWHDNFDNTLLEPDVLPAALPNLLINGSSGIAVGMATNIPPHNLGEVVDALVFMIDNFAKVEEITFEHLLNFIQGPDFPTGGILYRFREDGKTGDETDAIAQGYSVGRSRLILQAKAHFEEMSRNRSRIVITELPYQTNKVALLERIASLVRDGKIEGITDLRDESDRTGMRVVLELTRNVEPKAILADLFKYTPLQQTFGMQMLALVDNEPRTLSLKRMLHLFIQHRQVIIRRRSEYDLKRARARAHIVEGLLRALDILDEVIATIRRSQRVETARANLIKEFKFSEIQAQAILDMQLRRLAALERKKLQDEYKELLAQINYLEDLLAHPEKILGVIKDDLLAIREKYADARRTQIVDRTKGTLTTTDLLPDLDAWVSVGANGELKRQDQDKISPTILRQIGKGCEVALLAANTRDVLYLFSQDGRCARLSVHEIPQNGSPKHLAELTEFTRRDEISAALAIPRISSDECQGYLCLVTAGGAVKRVSMADFLSAAASNPTVINVDSKDRLGWVFHSSGEEEMILVSESGKSIRFDENDVRSMGLAAGGIGGMKLKKGERLIYAGVVEPSGDLVTFTQNGFAKRSSFDQYSTQGRNGGGIVTHKLNARTGKLASALVLGADNPDRDDSLNNRYVVAVTTRGVVQPIPVAEIPSMGRAVLGKSLVEPPSGAAIAVVQQVASCPEVVPSHGQENAGPPVVVIESEAGDQNLVEEESPAAASRQNGAPAAAKRTRSPKAKTTGNSATPDVPATATTKKPDARPARSSSKSNAAASSKKSAPPPAQAELGIETPVTPAKERAGAKSRQANASVADSATPPPARAESAPAARRPSRAKTPPKPAGSVQKTGRSATSSPPEKEPSTRQSGASKTGVTKSSSAQTDAAKPDSASASAGKAGPPTAAKSASGAKQPPPPKVRAVTSVNTSQKRQPKQK